GRPMKNNSRRSAWATRSRGTTTVRQGNGPWTGRAATASAQARVLQRISGGRRLIGPHSIIHARRGTGKNFGRHLEIVQPQLEPHALPGCEAVDLHQRLHGQTRHLQATLLAPGVPVAVEVHVLSWRGRVPAAGDARPWAL